MKHTYTEEENEIITNIASLTRSIVSGEVQTFEFTFLDYGKIDSIDFMCDLADIKDVTGD